MAATRTTVSKLLKIVYEKSAVAQFSAASPLLQFIGRNTKQRAVGEKIVVPLEIGVSGGVAYSSSGVLPKDNAQLIENAEYRRSRLYGSIGIDGELLDDASSSAAAFVDPLNREVNGMLRELRHVSSVLLAGDGTALLANIDSVTGNDTIVMTDVAKFIKGMSVDVLLISSGAEDAGVKGARIKNVNNRGATKSIQLDKDVLDAASINASPTLYAVYLKDSYEDATMGLGGIISTENPSIGNLGAIDRTENTWWQAYDMTSGSPRQITPNLMAEALEQIRIEVDEGERLWFMCHPSVKRQIIAQLYEKTQYMGTPASLRVWYDTITFAGNIPILSNKHIDPDKMYLFSLENFHLDQNHEGKWITNADGEGSMWRHVEGRHRWTAHWYRSWQLICKRPGATLVISDIDVTPT